MNLFSELSAAWERGETPSEKRAGAIDVLKRYRSEALEGMHRLLTAERRGLPAMYFLSDKTDEMLTALMLFASERFNGDGNSVCAVVACGGYGRRELAPFSDIDLMFLIPEGASEALREEVLSVVYLLWDAGMKIGYTIRTPAECVEDAKTDITVRTNLLEARFVCGDEELFYDFSNRYNALKTPEGIKFFVDAKRSERDERHKRMGLSQYMLEPNLKEGCGGLRDLHLLFWLMKYVFDVTDMRDLASRGILPRKTVDLFLHAHAFLDTLRCFLHFYRGKRGDILTMDAQKAVAPMLMYADRRGGLSDVERMMKHYYIISKNVGALTYYFSAIVEDALSGASDFETVDGQDSFCLINRRLDFRENAVVGPMDLLKLFWLKQKLKCDFSPAALQTAAHRAKEIRFVRKTDEARRMFFDVLTAPDSSDVLHAMLDTGVLGETIPVFKAVTGQMQFDMYHVYTTDEHTLKALEYVKSAAGESEFPSFESRRALYTAVLFHDIGKGAGGNHAEKGAVLAQKALADLGLDESERDVVTWLIRHHLLMSEVAFKRDIYDAKTIESFVKKVESPERLRLLYALTVADIKAVGPSVWNGFKARLLGDLFKTALEKMRGAAAEARDLSAEQRRLADDFNAARADVAFCVRNDVLPDMTEFTVITKDREGLFAAIAGAMTVIGASIAGATIATLNDKTVVDTFFVQDADAAALNGGKPTPLKSERKLARLKEKIRQVLNDGSEIETEIEKKRAQAVKKPFYYAPRVLIDNEASDACSLIEVDGNDSTGFLYAVTHEMTALNLQIVSAHIYTYGTHVVDVFYVCDAKGNKITDETRVREIKSRLLAVMELLR